MKLFEKKKKGFVNQVQGQPSGETPQVNAVQPQQKKKQGQKGKGKLQKGGRKSVKCHCCGGNHFMRDCQELKDAMANCVPRENRSPDFLAHTGQGPG